MYGVNSAGTVVNDILGFFGVRGAGVGIAIDTLTGNQQGVLLNLQDAFLETALGHGTGPMQRMMGTLGAAPWMNQFYVPSPMTQFPMMAPYCGCGYAGGEQTIDLAPGSTNIPIFSALFDGNRRMAGLTEARLRSDPYARAAFEASIGGRITDFGIRNDGVFTVQRFPTGYFPGQFAAQPFVGNMYGYMNQMNAATMGWAGGNAAYASSLGMNSFYGYAGAGFMNVLGMNSGARFAGPGWGPIDNSGPRGGWGYGSWNPNAMPGQINNTNPGYEQAHQAEAAAILADPSLSVEDKVTLLIMLIMKKMDQDIERQAQYINSIQQQQSSRGSNGGTGANGTNNGPFGQAGESSSPSIDVETMKLKRMIDKRGQMFDMLRQIIDKYNETAKNIIQSIGR